MSIFHHKLHRENLKNDLSRHNRLKVSVSDNSNYTNSLRQFYVGVGVTAAILLVSVSVLLASIVTYLVYSYDTYLIGMVSMVTVIFAIHRICDRHWQHLAYIQYLEKMEMDTFPEKFVKISRAMYFLPMHYAAQTNSFGRAMVNVLSPYYLSLICRY